MLNCLLQFGTIFRDTPDHIGAIETRFPQLGALGFLQTLVQRLFIPRVPFPSKEEEWYC